MGVRILPELPSDHRRVICSIDLPRPAPTRKRLVFRKIRNIDIVAFSNDIANSSLTNGITGNDVDKMADQYNNTLNLILNDHAPEQIRSVVLRPHAPWYTDQLRELKREKRRLERKYVRTNLTVYKQMYQAACTRYTQLLDATKMQYFKKKVADARQNKLFKFIDKMSNVKTPPILPKHDSAKELAERFSEHFESKIINIRRELIIAVPLRRITDERSCQSSFTSFRPASETYVKNIVLSSKSKSCQLDPIPTWLLKGCIDSLLPSITRIINSSLAQATVPSKLKESVILPNIKKATLEPEDFDNFRPISNLPFISKTLERIVASQMDSYLTENSLYADMQSAYRKHRSTETALIRVMNDISRAIDDRHECVLVLLDLSAAFDTIDHAILFMRLECRYGISGNALAWLKSYLKDRQQRVVINGTYSEPRSTTCGVPQGSVLGPLLFALYIAPLEDVISAHGIDVMMYADDSQLYIVLEKTNRPQTLQKLELCIDDIIAWNIQNGLKCNPSKTEVIHFYSRFSPSDHIQQLRVGNHTIDVVNEVRDLGVTLDSTLALSQHTNNISRKASRAIYQIAKVTRFLSKQDTERVVHAFISSKLDYCNGLLYGLPSCQINKLQRLQNTAARLITKAKKSEHITPILQNLHWLPVEQRIIFKLLITTYKALNGMAPEYLSNLLTLYRPSRNLRSSSSLNLIVPKTRTATYGDRAFSYAAPTLWNELPLSIKNSETLACFKNKLKTHLFKKAFNV